MIIDHIWIVVKNIEKGIQYWKNIFEYLQMTEIVINTRQKVKVVFLKKENSLPIKLIEPLDDSSTIYSFARKGGGLHHLCFKCGNVDMEIKVLREKGLRLLSTPQPGEAFDNENIAFFYGKQGLNIELIDTGKRAGILNN